MHTFNALSFRSTALFYAREFKLFLRSYLHRDSLAKQSMRKHQNSKKGLSAFVIANGPSINTLSPHKISRYLTEKSFDLFCVNTFYKSDFFAQLPKVHLVLSDPHSWSSEILSSEILGPQLIAGKIHSLFLPSSQKYNASMFLKSISCSYSSFEELSSRLTYFNDSENSIVFSKNINPTRPRGYVSMTAFKALAIAGYLGYSAIYICGFDNTYPYLMRADSMNRVYSTDIHFDNKSYPNDSQKDYYYANNNIDVAGALIDISMLFSCLKHRFHRLPITNLDLDSFTDAFDKNNSLDVYS